jgi:hypothetical protein
LIIVRSCERAADSCKQHWPQTPAAPPIANRPDRIAGLIEGGRTRYGNAPVATAVVAALAATAAGAPIATITQTG